MSLKTAEQFEENMHFLVKGIRGLEHKRYIKESKGSKEANTTRLRMKRFKNYLKRTDNYLLPTEFSENEDMLNNWLCSLKSEMKEKNNGDALLFVSKIYDRLDGIYENLYGSKFSGKTHKTGVR
jgi:hypothetical protein